MPAVTSEAVAAYSDHVGFLARKYKGFAQAEYDDLMQEGMIAVWQSLARGLRPSSEVIEYRLISWVRYLDRLTRNDGIAYERLLPIEDYSVLETW